MWVRVRMATPSINGSAHTHTRRRDIRFRSKKKKKKKKKEKSKKASCTSIGARVALLTMSKNFSSATKISSPILPSMFAIFSLSASSTAEVAHQTLTPCPIEHGVLGMVRITFVTPRPFANVRIGVPAITERIVASEPTAPCNSLISEGTF